MLPILVTTATRPPEGIPFLAMTNASTRALTAKASVFFFAAQGARRIVIADATDTLLLNADDLSMLDQLGVKVEQLAYRQDDARIKQRGKGYGEGELIRFALRTSLLLQQSDHFFKCTGKVYCRNFPAIRQLIEKHKVSGIFWRWIGDGTALMPWADARFYFTSRAFAESHLIPAYLRTEDSTSAAEYHLFNALNETCRQGKALRPLLTGFAGGSGEQYFDAGLGALDFSFPCWLGTP